MPLCLESAEMKAMDDASDKVISRDAVWPIR